MIAEAAPLSRRLLSPATLASFTDALMLSGLVSGATVGSWLAAEPPLDRSFAPVRGPHGRHPKTARAAPGATKSPGRKGDPGDDGVAVTAPLPESTVVVHKSARLTEILARVNLPAA